MKIKLEEKKVDVLTRHQANEMQIERAYAIEKTNSRISQLWSNQNHPSPSLNIYKFIYRKRSNPYLRKA